MTVTREAVAARKPFTTRATRWVGRRAAGPASRDRGIAAARRSRRRTRAGAAVRRRRSDPARRACWDCAFRREFGGPGGRVRDVLVRGDPDRARQFQCRAGASRALRVLRAPAEQPCDARGARRVVPARQRGHRRRQRDHGCGGADPLERGHQGAARHRRRTATQRLQVLFHRHAVRRCGGGVGSGCQRSRRAGDHSRGSGRGRIVRRLGRIRPAHHRQRRNAVHRGRSQAPTRSSRCPTAPTSGTRPRSCSCIWRRWRSASRMRCFDDAVDYVRTKARPASHSVADTADTDPFVLQAVGEISAAAASAEAVVLTAADAIDRLVDQGRQHDPECGRRGRRHGREGATGRRAVDDLCGGAALRHRRGVGHRPRAEPGPALAQRANRGDPQPVGVQGICGGQLRRQRRLAAGQRLLLSHPPPHPPPRPP